MGDTINGNGSGTNGNNSNKDGPRHGQPSSSQPDTTNNPASASVLVLGGSSAVGPAAIQLLHHALGPDAPILSTNSPRHDRRLTASLSPDGGLGATACVDYTAHPTPAGLAEAVRRACQQHQQGKGSGGGAAGVDAIVDAVGAVEAAGEEGRRAFFGLLRPGGARAFAAVATTTRHKLAELPEGVRGIMVVGRMAFLDGGDGSGQGAGGKRGVGVMGRLTALVEEGKFALPVGVEIAGSVFEAIRDGLQRLRVEGVSGVRLVVRL